MIGGSTGSRSDSDATGNSEVIYRLLLSYEVMYESAGAARS